MDFIAFHFIATVAEQEILLARLQYSPFNGFEERSDRLIAYLSIENDKAEFREELQLLLQELGVSLETEEVAGQNWNAQWEASFQPIQVNDFVGVRAEFHPPFDGVQHELLIHPRMAFGTGHHATTYLMMERMARLDWAGQAVFDYGCGTGILAILAKKLGAELIDAVDIEEEAFANTLVNMKANQVDDISVFHGDLNAVPMRVYDIILANINRNVILASLPALYERLGAGAHLLLSGVLEKDREQVISRSIELGLELLDQAERSGWMMIHLRK